MNATIEDLISMNEAAKRAKMAPCRFKAFAEKHGLLIPDGGGEKQQRYKVLWPEVVAARINQPRTHKVSRPLLGVSKLNPRVRC